MRFPIVFLFCVSTAFAALDWENNMVVLNAQPEAKSVEGVYHFKNSGNAQVTITRIVNSCGCTTSRISRKTLAPGERGELRAEFKIGGRRGEQNKVIEVRTDDGERHRLGLRVNIGELIALSRSILLWKRSEPLETKSVTLNVTRPEPLEITRVDSSNALFKTTLTEIEKGRAYRLDVTPQSLSEQARATIELIAADKHVFPVRVRIH